ncbi:response regulator [Bradyrhizobium barranii]
MGVGTTVKVYLPRFFGVEETSGAPEPKANIGASLHKETILVVEDDDRVRNISSESLRDLGYTVVEAAGAKEAIRKIDDGLVPDLLFTDVVMPDTTGAELASRALERLPGLKVLFTTGYTRNAIVHNGMLDAGRHLISKPFNIEDLAAKVRGLLDEI